MITKITDKNSENYKSLFRDAGSLLGGNAESITTLNEYFFHLPQIIASKKFEPKYVILPIDEELFEINANTREIKVPDTFKKIAGVEGDQVAEVIYFSIDRYFDTMDLNNQNIYIEWYGPDGEDGISEEFVRDISKKDKIIFGWALHEEITQKAGQVEFAVRFYSKDEDGNVEYSLRTLPQRITISKGLEMDSMGDTTGIGVMSKENQKFILDRIVASKPDDGVYVPKNPELLEMYYTTSGAFGKDFTMTKTEVLLDSATGEYKIYLNAYVPDTGIITYNLLKCKPEDVNHSSERIRLEFEMVKTKDTEYKKNNIYYIDNNGVINPLEEGADYDIGEEIPREDEDTKIYENMAVCDLSNMGTGDFCIEIVNTVGITSNKNFVTGVISKPAPSDPTTGWLFENTDYVSKLFSDDANSDEIIELELDHEVYRNYPNHEVTTYQWYKGEKPDPKNKIEGAIESNYFVTEADNGAQAYYCLEISNTLNGITTIGNKYRLYRVTQYPKAFTEDDIIFDYEVLSNGNVYVDGDGFTFGIKGDIASDGYFIEVYYQPQVNQDYKQEQTIEIIGKNSYTYKPEHANRNYKFRIINKLNGAIANEAYETKEVYIVS